MKKTTTMLLLVLMTLAAKAQIFQEVMHADFEDLALVKLEKEGLVYAAGYGGGPELVLWRINHAYWQTMGLKFGRPVLQKKQSYISEHLFDGDDGIEVLVTYLSGNDWYTTIFDDDGSILYDIPYAYEARVVDDGQMTKLVCHHRGIFPGYSTVHRLPGKYTGLAPAPVVQGGGSGTAWPNPTDGAAYLQWSLPDGMQGGNLRLGTADGKALPTQPLQGTTGSTELLPAGTAPGVYSYQVEGTDISGKVIVR